MILATVHSLNNVPIRLTEERWEHIVDAHPYMTQYYEDLLDAVYNPEYIFPGHRGSLIAVVMMAKRLAIESQEEELLRLARERVDLPAGKLWLKYQPDVDLLWIGLKEHPEPTNTKDDVEHGLIFNYEGRKLVSVEVLDLYGVYIS